MKADLESQQRGASRSIFSNSIATMSYNYREALKNLWPNFKAQAGFEPGICLESLEGPI